MASGSFIFPSRPLVVGIAFMVQHMISGGGLNTPSPPGRTILGGTRGAGGIT